MTQPQPAIDLRLFAALASRTPADASSYPIEAGMSVKQLLAKIQVPPADVKLIFINGVRGRLESRLHGGERVGIFPPVGGG